MNIEDGNFRAPIMPEEEHNISFSGKHTKINYNLHFDRSPFIKSVLQPEINTNGKIKMTSLGKCSYKESPTIDTVPNLSFIVDNGLGFDSHPADWFDTYFPRKRKESTHPKAVTLDIFTGWLNVKAMMANAGKRGGKYSDFKDFTKRELMAHLGVYLLHSISPSPLIEMKYKHHADDPVNGSHVYNRIFGIKGVTRQKEFKAFFACVDPIILTPPTNTHQNWKIDSLLKQILRISQSAIHIGRYISTDEQGIEFQGRHKDRQRITFKKVGDGLFGRRALC